MMMKNLAKFLNEDTKQILDRHLRVGREKPVSYLPIKTVENVVGVSVSEYISMIEDLGNKGVAFGTEECCISSGAVYAYSCSDLEKILSENQDILLAHGWPVIAGDFVKRIAAEWIDERNPIMPIIRKAFGEA